MANKCITLLQATRAMFVKRFGLEPATPTDRGFDNNVALAWRNAAGTADVEAINVNGSDVVTLPGGATVPTGKTLAVTDATGLTIGGVIVPQYLHKFWSGIGAAAAVSGTALIADATYIVTGVKVSFGTASTSGTFTIEKLTGTTAPGGGTALLTSALALDGAANTVATGVLTATTADLTLASGNRLGFVFGGTVTNLADMAITITLKRA